MGRESVALSHSASVMGIPPRHSCYNSLMQPIYLDYNATTPLDPAHAKGETTMTVTLEEAQARLPELISRLQPGEEIVITAGGQPVARLQAEASSNRKPRKAGSAKGLLTIISDDDEHLKDFEEYMG
jgi:antitoxin (DNA-binding transcriptional repressor) of toxin-antitoxin stability system